MEKINLLEFVRKRPGMFIGSTNYSGILELLTHLIEDLKEIGVNEINFLLKENNRLIVEGVSLKSLHDIQEYLILINGYPDKNIYSSFIEIIGLSEFTDIQVYDSNKFLNVKSCNGKAEIFTQNIHSDLLKIKIDFTLDKTIFDYFELNYESLNYLFRRFAFLNSDIKIRSIDQSKDNEQVNFFHYPKGLVEIIDFELKKNFLYNSIAFKLSFNKKTDFSYSLALAFVKSYWIKPKIKVYANDKETILGGSLLDGIFQGFKNFFKEEALKKNINMNISNAKFKKHLLLYAAVRGELSYLGSTKWKLRTPKVQLEIKEFVYLELQLYFSDKEDELKDVIDVLQDNY